MMIPNYVFVNDTPQVFEGFYESNLYNPDMEYCYNEEREEGEPEMEVDFEPFKKDVGEGIANLLSDLIVCEDGFITKCEFKDIDSPKYYNYGTDKLVLNLDLDLDKLKEWSLSEGVKDEFDKYLKEKYTSHSGYCSFVENNVDDYYEKSFEDYSNVVVEFYMLTKIYDSIEVVKCAKSGVDTPYTCDTWELANECFYNNLKEVA